MSVEGDMSRPILETATDRTTACIVRERKEERYRGVAVLTRMYATENKNDVVILH